MEILGAQWAWTHWFIFIVTCYRFDFELHGTALRGRAS